LLQKQCIEHLTVTNQTGQAADAFWTGTKIIVA